MASIQSFEIERMESEIARLTEQRDALLAAVRDVALAAHSQHCDPFGDCWERSCLKARVAIEKARTK